MQTTEEHFELFIDTCQFWIDYFGITDWNVDYQFGGEVEELEGSNPVSFISTSYEDRYAIIWFTSEAPDRLLTDLEIQKSAFHEVCELLLADFFLLAQSRWVSYDQLVSSSHAVIHRLQNSVFSELQIKEEA